MSNVNFSNSNLNGVNFSNANLKGVEFGKRVPLDCESKITAMSMNGNDIAVACEDN